MIFSAKKQALKVCALVLMSAVILTVFNLPAKQAKAFVIPQLTFETNPALVVSTPIISANTTAQNVKLFSLDMVANSVINILVNQLSDMIVNWVATGQMGSPLFVRNWQGFLLNAADVALSQFDQYLIANGLPSACTPFQEFLRVGLSVNNPYRRSYLGRLSCTFDDIKNNAEAFERYAQNFQDGGWITFNALNRGNNPFSLYLEGLDEMEETVERATQANLNEALAGGGYLSKIEEKTNTLIQSPGKYIGSYVEAHASSRLTRMLGSHTIADLITNLINAAITRGLTTLVK